MISKYLPRPGADSLIVVFLGWGFPAEMFAGLSKPGYNILLLSDYRDFHPEEVERIVSGLGKWREVVVIGWSFGVRIATEFLRVTSQNVTLRLAVNGTVAHVSDKSGIPEAVFGGTLAGLSSPAYIKFLRRCGLKNPEIAEDFDMQPLRDELNMFGQMPPCPAAEAEVWDKAVIGGADRIFPSANQLNAWEGHTDCHEYDSLAHLPDFQEIIDDFVIDKSKVTEKFDTAGENYTANARSQREVAESVAVFVRSGLRSLPEGAAILELGCGSGLLTEMYCDALKASSRLILSDIRPESDLPGKLHESGCRAAVEYIGMDAEAAAFTGRLLKPESVDMIVSSSMFQWLNSPQRMLAKCAAALRCGGVIVLSFYAPGTLAEITSVTRRGLKYPTAAGMRRTARRAGLKVAECREISRQMAFDTPKDAFRHLKLTGVNALGRTAAASQVRSLMENWDRNEEGKATLTFNSVIMVLKK